MGRGKDKTIQLRDILNMDPREQAGLGNLVRMGRVKCNGTATVRDKDGNVRYAADAKPGDYGEQHLG